MPETNQEKTEQPTSKKLRDAREKGNVAQSHEVGNAVVLLVGMLLLLMMGGQIMTGLKTSSRSIFSNLNAFDLTAHSVPLYFRSGVFYLMKLLAPFSLLVMILAVLTRLIQNGWVFTAKPLEPKPEKLNPFTGIKRLVSARGMAEMAKGVLKLLIIAIIGYYTIKAALPGFIKFIDEDTASVLSIISSTAFGLGLRAGIAILILAVLDYLFQYWRHHKDLMMSKQELKDELKQTEGDPLIKSRVREIQIKLSMHRMIKQLPTADVIVTNPTRVAVALKYDPTTMSAPKVIAKGLRLVAERIKEIARAHDIPIIEEPELARALYRTVPLGWEIPYDLYQAVAEVLALVYRLREAVR